MKPQSDQTSSSNSTLPSNKVVSSTITSQLLNRANGGGPQQDVIGFAKASGDMNDVERLKEENRRLKRTLLERFEETFY
jgi:hypothetical protein